MDTSLPQLIFEQTQADGWLSHPATTAVSAILIAALGIAVGFVAYKIIKRALNKA